MKNLLIVFVLFTVLLYSNFTTAEDAQQQNTSEQQEITKKQQKQKENDKNKPEQTTKAKQKQNNQPSVPPPAGMPEVKSLTPPAKPLKPVLPENKPIQTENFTPPPPAEMPQPQPLTPPAQPLKPITPTKKQTGQKPQFAVPPPAGMPEVKNLTPQPEKQKQTKQSTLQETYATTKKIDKKLPATTKKQIKSTKPQITFMPGIFYRFSFNSVSEFPFNPQGETQPHRQYGMQLLRLSPTLALKDKLSFRLSVDVLRGQVFGDNDAWASAETEHLNIYSDNPGGNLSSFRLRELFVAWQSKVGLLRVGLQASKWGLGLVANNGEQNTHRFGEAWYGDYVGRILFATKPLLPIAKNAFTTNFLFIVAGDMVVEDENARLSDGDAAFQAVGALLYKTEPITAGVYSVYRYQSDRDGDELKVGVFDFYFQSKSTFWQTSWLEMTPTWACEFAVITGSTTRVQSTHAPDGLNILAFGGVVRTGVELHALHTALMLEVGYASGDENPYDDTSHTFTFDADYKTGLILFDEILRNATAYSVLEAQNPEHSANAPKGIEALATSGRIANAIYLFPTITLKPIDYGEFIAGVLMAWSDALLMDPYRTTQSGTIANIYGATEHSHYLGTEVDISYRHWWRIGKDIRFFARAQAGVFFAGDAFLRRDGSKPKEVSKLLINAGFSWQ